MAESARTHTLVCALPIKGQPTHYNNYHQPHRTAVINFIRRLNLHKYIKSDDARRASSLSQNLKPNYVAQSELYMEEIICAAESNRNTRQQMHISWIEAEMFAGWGLTDGNLSSLAQNQRRDTHIINTRKRSLRQVLTI